ncbi:MAG TPA: metalloregulator ArsR/SmtB family transcription factor [Rhodothermales bacterium]|nr:metalloregulator ArsR/SmtB family transcription factor [Rhodothermales bacterium]HRR08001.1 metalloregulator ArsR/SmtB family transcription factor [Rhodothermales bacterium]
MGAINTESFSVPQNELASFARILAHPARIAILEQLMERGATHCGKLDLPLAQPTISAHLKELRQIGLVYGKVEGTSVCYCINLETWERMREAFDTFFVKLRYVEALHAPIESNQYHTST